MLAEIPARRLPMRLMSTILFSVAAVFGTAVQADENNAGSTESYINYVTIQPCTSWQYDGSISGYKCNFHSFRVDVPEYRDVQRLADLVDTLERKIADLEARVSRLENQ
jgi:hypothetical protein